MAGPRWPLRAATIGLAVLAAGACRSGTSGLEWLPADAAVVRCTTAGRTRMPPVLLGLPVPEAPTGLLARRLDPMALNDMGFTRDRPACAGLIAPSENEIADARGNVAALELIMKRTSDAAVRTMPCACETADDLGLRPMLPACQSLASRPCKPSDEDREELGALVAPVAEAIERTPVPRLHWRLVGPTDRPDWLGAHVDDLLARHGGGTTVYQKGQAVPGRDNYVLLRTLLERDDVKLVARQDSGRALLVVRVVKGVMILDHFEYPVVRPELIGLLSAIDNARPQDVTGALGRPSHPWGAVLPPKDGNLVQIDVPVLDRVDRMMVSVSSLGEVPYDPLAEERTGPSPMVDRLAIQAPFGEDGLALRFKAELSTEGGMWAGGLTKQDLGPESLTLELPNAGPGFVAANERPPPFLLRGTSTEDLAVHGLTRLGILFEALEKEYPGAVDGTTHDWEVRLPQGSLAYGGAITPPPGAKAIAEQVMERAYELTGEVDVDRKTVTVDLEPD